MGYYAKPLVFQFALLVANFWNERYLQNHCPLVAKFGTWLANLLWGSDFAYVTHNGGGGNTMHISPVRRYFSLHRDI